MLSEPIKRSWGTPDSAKFNGFNSATKSKARQVSDESDVSSEVEEDIQELMLSNDEDNPTWK